MNTPEDQWWDTQAGEYVLGTLSDDDRDMFEKIISHDDDAMRRVVWWQEKLSSLDNDTEQYDPPARVWQSTENELGFTTSMTADPIVIDSDTESITLQDLRSGSRSKLALWRGLTALVTAASLFLAFTLWQDRVADDIGPRSNYDGISVINTTQSDTLWVVNTDSIGKFVKVTAVSPPEAVANQSYNLWLEMPDSQDVSLMGPLPMVAGESIVLSLPVPIEPGVAFTVSQEPAGASPASTPAGPVLYQGLYQKLIQTES